MEHKKNPAIYKLIDLLEPIADKHETEGDMYWVTESLTNTKISDENMTQHGSCECFCEKCIDDAVDRKHREWSIERNVLLGKIYEAESKGYYTHFGYSNSDDKYCFRKVKVNGQQKEMMKKELKTNYRIGHKFSKDYMRLIMYETDGFKYCDSCGIQFTTSLLLHDQELEYWEELTDEQYNTLNAGQAYNLIAILREGGYETHKLNDRVIALAERVLNIITTK